jgi:MFS family permease
MIGVLSGPAFDAGYFRYLIALGTFMIPFGFMMTSLCRTYWQTMLAQAFLIGLGNGFLFIPSVAILPQYFTTHKALANGIAASGSSFGGIIYPIVFRQLYPRIGFQWATRVLGFIALATAGFSCFIMRPRIIPKQKRHLTDLSAFKETPYTLFCFGMFFGFFGEEYSTSRPSLLTPHSGFYGPVYYLQSYAISSGITDANLGFYLLPILNAASVAGRIVPNIVTDLIGPLNVLVPGSLITGILAFAWIGIKNLPGVIVFALLYGFFSGIFVSLPPVALITLSPDLRKLGTRMGQSFFTSAFGLLVGAPVSGAILSKTGSFLGLQLFSGCAIIVAAVLLGAARVNRVGWDVRIRA